MAEMKTTRNAGSVAAFLDGIQDQERRKDCLAVLEIMQRATGAEPCMWGSSIVGFGSYHYKYDSGREGDWFLAGFSPRKRDLTLYIVSGFEPHATLLERLGKYKTGRSCLYVRRLADVNLDMLRQLIEGSVRHVAESQQAR